MMSGPSGLTTNPLSSPDANAATELLQQEQIQQIFNQIVQEAQQFQPQINGPGAPAPQAAAGAQDALAGEGRGAAGDPGGLAGPAEDADVSVDDLMAMDLQPAAAEGAEAAGGWLPELGGEVEDFAMYLADFL